jgi:hypothetical protein
VVIDPRRRCVALHNHGRWPYVARCVRGRMHKGNHIDEYGNEWSDPV